MTNRQFPGGVWPVMLTPYTQDHQVDAEALKRLVDWYIARGVSGLFAVCQSSEMFRLTLAEREQIARAVVQAAAGRVPVIASGHVSDTVEAQAEELGRIAATGVDAVILLSNRLAAADEGDLIWLNRLDALLGRLDPGIPLGFYECPFPYKRLLSVELIQALLSYRRFYFLKDTCCDLAQVVEKSAAAAGSSLRVYNANTTTLLESLRGGVAGFSGVMANFHPELYVWLCEHPDDPRAEAVQEHLTMMSLIERQVYPVNAKYAMTLQGVSMQIEARTADMAAFTETSRSEVRQLLSLSGRVGAWLGL